MSEAKIERVENTTVACPIVYGSMAYYLGKKAEEFATHRWVLYVRGPQGEDISTFVEKVTFTLHPSFADPVRVVTSAPFELNEGGWGEFQVMIRIHFKDPDEQPVDLLHHLRLYPPAHQPQLTQKKPVVAENYDEIVFFNPKREFYECLMRYGTTSSVAPKTEPVSAAPEGADSQTQGAQGAALPQRLLNAEYFTPFDDNLDLEALLAIQDHLHREINDARERLVNCEAEIVDAMARRQQELQATVSASASAANAAALQQQQQMQQQQQQQLQAMEMQAYQQMQAMHMQQQQQQQQQQMQQGVHMTHQMMYQ